MSYFLRTRATKRRGGMRRDAFALRAARLARFTREDRAYSDSRLLKTFENDCFAVYIDN